MIRDSKDRHRKLPYHVKSYEELRPLAKVLYGVAPGKLFYEVMSIKEGVEKPPFLQITEEHLHKICGQRKWELCLDDVEDGVVFIQGRAYPDYFFYCVAPEDKRPGDIWDELEGTEELEEPKPEVTIPYQLLPGGTLGVAGARVGDRMISLLEGLGHISDFCITQDVKGEVGVEFTPDTEGATPSIYSKDGVPLCWPNAERMLFFVGPGDTGRFDSRPDDSVFYKQDEKVYVTDDPGVYKCRDTDSAVKAHFCEYRIMRNGNNYRVYPYGTTSWTGEFDHRLQKPKVVGHKYCWKAEDE